MSNRDASGLDRRGFLQRVGQGTALAGLGLGVTAGAAARTRVAQADPKAPTTGRLLENGETIGLGIIGVGGMGGAHLGELLAMEKQGTNIQVRAVSDVYERRKQGAVQRVKAETDRGIDAYTDYKDLLARPDIHGVIIATPDHWHAKNSIDAMKAGKDVYCQKPVTLTIEEALDVRDTAYQTGRVFQCGAQYTSDDFYWQARRIIREGGIGKVVWAQADYSRNSGNPDSPQGGEWNYRIDEDAGPNAEGDAYIDWEQWVKPAGMRPWNAAHFFQFRKFWDYSGGIATDLMYHVIAPLTIALDLSAPEKASAAGGIFVQFDEHLPKEYRREVPDTFMITLDYPEDVTIVLTSSMANRQGNPTIIRGHKATIRRDEGGLKVTAEDEFKEWFAGKYGAEEITVPLESREDHMTNWLNAMRTRGPVHCDAETAYRAMAATKMGCDAYREEKTIFWDNEKERYVRRHPRPDRKSKTCV